LEEISSKAVNRNDPESWQKWPYDSGKGFISPFSDYDLEACWENRQNQKIIRVFQTIWNCTQIWLEKWDRYGVMRPAKIRLNSGKVVTKPEWKTISNWLHWDQNPWSEPDFVRVQGLVTLTDHTETSGGFHCVPQFPSRFISWSLKNSVNMNRNALVTVPEQDPIRQEIKKIKMQAGSLLIWDSRTPHGNYPNEGEGFRMVQFLTFKKVKGEEKEMKRNGVETKLELARKRRTNQKEEEPQQDNSKNKKYFPDLLTDLGKKILGSIDWDD